MPLLLKIDGWTPWLETRPAVVPWWTAKKMRWIVTYVLTMYYSQYTHRYELTPIQW